MVVLEIGVPKFQLSENRKIKSAFKPILFLK